MTGMNWSKVQDASKVARARTEPLPGGGYPIGSREICYCGEPANHTWPGKDQGLPHPRPTEGDG